MSESSENPRTPAGEREPEGMEDSPAEGHTPEAGHPTLGAGTPEEGEGTASMESTPEISTEDQGGDLTGPTPGGEQGTPPKEE
ncbi:MAG TPA: hypothetical protein VGV57_09065 [Thermoleophilaceae bacterium]|nr:hypothetical protein [Thermoleophilaceae bacterium]